MDEPSMQGSALPPELPPSEDPSWKDVLRNKFQGLHLSDRFRSLPKSFEPMILAEWASQAVQAQGFGFYGRVITILLSTYFLANISGLLVGRFIPEPPTSRAPRPTSFTKTTRNLDEYNVIFSRNLFNSQGLIPGDEGPSGFPTTGTQDLGGAPVKTTLPFNLIGTVILHDELRSIATIEDKSAAMIYPVRVQDEIPSKAKIVKIEPSRVIFVNTSSGRREFVELPLDANITNPRISVGGGGRGSSGTPIERVSPTQFNVPRAEVDKALADLNNVLTQARCVPHIENGLPAGYKCFQIVPGSIYDKLGMQNGDTICGINGQNLSDPSKAFEQLANLKEANHIELCIKRDGRQQNFAYDIR